MSHRRRRERYLGWKYKIDHKWMGMDKWRRTVKVGQKNCRTGKDVLRVAEMRRTKNTWKREK